MSIKISHLYYGIHNTVSLQTLAGTILIYSSPSKQAKMLGSLGAVDVLLKDNLCGSQFHCGAAVN